MIPEHHETFSDGAIGFATATAAEITMGFGVSTSGTPNVVTGPYLRPDDVIADHTSGPLAQWGCHQLEVAKGVPIYLTAVTVSQAGTNSAVTQSGSGPAVTLSGTPVDDFPNAQIKMRSGGARGTATFAYTLDGVLWSPTITTAASYPIPGSGLTALFPVGSSAAYAVGAVTATGSTQTISAVSSYGTTPPAITLTGVLLSSIDLHVEALTSGARGTWTGRYSTDGGLTFTGFTSGATVAVGSTGLTLNITTGNAATDNVWRATTTTGVAPTITLTGTPAGAYGIRIECTTAGARGTSVIRWSSDGGSTWTSGVTTAATVVLGATGLTANIATGVMLTDNVWAATSAASSPYAEDETYSWTSVAPYTSTANFGAAYDVADASGIAWKSGVWLGQPGGATDADKATAAAAVVAAASAKVAQSEAAHRFRTLGVELPDVSDTLAGDNALGAELDSLYDSRLFVCYGFCDLVSSIDKMTYKRSSSWLAVSRMRSVGRKIDPSWLGLGRLPDKDHPAMVSGIFHDENNREGPNGHRWVTLRRVEGLDGFYLTNFWLFSPVGSDYRYVQMRRVINDQARLVRARLLQLVSGNVRTYPSPAPDGKVVGSILEEDAVTIEGEVNDLLLREITNKGDAEKAWIEIDRTNPLKVDETLKYRSRTRLPGYIKTIDGDFGFAL